MRLSVALAVLGVEFLLSTAQLGCDRDALPPTGQVLIYLDTDAPVGESGDQALDDSSPVPLFDRVLVELFPPESQTPCEECTRELVANPLLMRQRGFSFGVVPQPRVLGVRARLRLFRSAGGAAARRESTVELVGYLPAVGEEGITEITAVFRTDNVGQPQGSLAAPIRFEAGPQTTSLQGTWPGAEIVPCELPAPAGTACFPGGAFFLGSPRVIAEEGLGGQREHLVVLAPFFLDLKEVTVSELRSSGLAKLDSHGRALDPLDDSQDSIGGLCNYTTQVGSHEQQPVMCTSWQLADRYCRSKGGTLPTEAQFEYAASRRGTRLYPWGDREPGCSDAVVARQLAKEAGGCAKETSLFDRVLSEPAGSGRLDRVQAAEHTVWDLGANLSEWTQDYYQDDEEPCWAPALLTNPLCSTPGRYPQVRSTKGGNLSALPVDYVQVRRGSSAADDTFHSAEVGFRCAYPGIPPGS